MKVLLVTSQVTFIPRNYDDLIVGLADCPQIGGLLILNNRSFSLKAKAARLILSGATRLGWTLLKNQSARSTRRRTAAYSAKEKPVWTLKTINSPEALELVQKNGFDLILNARTRYIYKSAILSAAKFGCLNIHHGLLPEQRGAMCDLRALHERRPAGFSIHLMTEQIDAGAIAARVTVDDGTENNYTAYLAKSSKRELNEVKRVLTEIEAADRINTEPNSASKEIAVCRTPSFQEIRTMIRGGLQL